LLAVSSVDFDVLVAVALTGAEEVMLAISIGEIPLLLPGCCSRTNQRAVKPIGKMRSIGIESRGW
jgi:hypothetical protein